MKNTYRSEPSKDVEGIHIVDIDKKTNTVAMSIDGCKVTAVCRENNNTEIYSRGKGILIESVITKRYAEI